MSVITITIYRRDGTVETESFTTERQALVYCREEVRWESTQRVVCPAIGFDQKGDFA